MKLHVMSDLHLEFGGMDLTPMGDVLVLAGDIHVGTRAKNWIAQACKYYNAVILVLGNHEFYQEDYDYTIAGWRDIEEDFTNLFVLHNDYIVLDNVRFVGTTLWTYGDKPLLNDYNLIWKNGRLLKIRDTQDFHLHATRFLDETLALPFDGETVVVTHHAPIPECVVPKYRGDKINCMFHADLNNMIKDNDIKYWIHGHMHDSIQLDYADTKIVCNPRGYVGYGANFGFEYDLVLEV